MSVETKIKELSTGSMRAPRQSCHAATTPVFKLGIKTSPDIKAGGLVLGTCTRHITLETVLLLERLLSSISQTTL